MGSKKVILKTTYVLLCMIAVMAVMSVLEILPYPAGSKILATCLLVFVSSALLSINLNYTIKRGWRWISLIGAVASIATSAIMSAVVWGGLDIQPIDSVYLSTLLVAGVVGHHQLLGLADLSPSRQWLQIVSGWILIAILIGTLYVLWCQPADWLLKPLTVAGIVSTLLTIVIPLSARFEKPINQT